MFIYGMKNPMISPSKRPPSLSGFNTSLRGFPIVKEMKLPEYR